MSPIVSSLPGRLRVRTPALRRADAAERVGAALARLDGVTRVESNTGAGSLVLWFDPDQIGADADAFEARVERTLTEALTAPRPAVARSTRMRVNRYAKVGMLGSLATSMALAATGQKRWHAVTGAVFLGCLSVHLGLHRRHLLR